jgi:hypothetical protein
VRPVVEEPPLAGTNWISGLTIERDVWTKSQKRGLDSEIAALCQFLRHCKRLSNEKRADEYLAFDNLPAPGTS